MTGLPLSGEPSPGPLLCDWVEGSSWTRKRLDAMAKGTLVLWTGGGRCGTREASSQDGMVRGPSKRKGIQESGNGAKPKQVLPLSRHEALSLLPDPKNSSQITTLLSRPSPNLLQSWHSPDLGGRSTEVFSWLWGTVSSSWGSKTEEFPEDRYRKRPRHLRETEAREVRATAGHLSSRRDFWIGIRQTGRGRG